LLGVGRALLAVLLTVSCASDTVVTRSVCGAPPAPEARLETGRMLVLPGIANTHFHLSSFVDAAREQLPGFDIEIRRWGVRFLSFRNLRTRERNLETAAEIAAELTEWRGQHPDERLYLMGFSGGGAIALLIAAALPDDVTIDRMVLVAPAISPGYPIEGEVLPRVGEFVVNYASRRDLQVGWGTRTFGTIDGERTDSAGAVGFELAHPKLLEWHWSARALDLGHRGNHLSYLGRRWQAAMLLPAVDPRSSAETLRAAWARPCGGGE
jgi:pimeloyl-ACP methyl ester carboxylesterase